MKTRGRGSMKQGRGDVRKGRDVDGSGSVCNAMEGSLRAGQ